MNYPARRTHATTRGVVLPVLVALSLAACDSAGPSGVNRAADNALSSIAGAQTELFTLVENPRLNSSQASLLAHIRTRPAAENVRVARLALSPGAILQSGRAVDFTLAPSHRVAARMLHTSRPMPDAVFWAGSLEEEDGVVTLALTRDGITATIQRRTAVYQVEPIGEGLHAIIRIDPSKLPPMDPIDYDSVMPVDTSAASHQRRSSANHHDAQVSPYAAGDPEVHLLVVYTPAVAATHGSVSGLIAQAVGELNQANANSGAYVDFKVVHTAQVNYDEFSAPTYRAHVDRLQGRADGYMDNVHSLRTQYLADLVILLVADVRAGGRAASIPAAPATAFAVVTSIAATAPEYVFAHEVGHLMGGCHDRATLAAQGAPNSCPRQYGHGYVAPTNGWRTIMSYSNPCFGCLAVPHWSNPNVLRGGLPMGTTTYENVTRVFQENRWAIRNFVTLPRPENFTLANRGAIGVNPYLTWSGVPNGLYFTWRCDPALTNCYNFVNWESLSGYSPNPPFDVYDGHYLLTDHSPPCSQRELWYGVYTQTVHGQSAWSDVVIACVRPAP